MWQKGRANLLTIVKITAIAVNGLMTCLMAKENKSGKIKLTIKVIS